MAIIVEKILIKNLPSLFAIFIIFLLLRFLIDETAIFGVFFYFSIIYCIVNNEITCSNLTKLDFKDKLGIALAIWILNCILGLTAPTGILAIVAIILFFRRRKWLANLFRTEGFGTGVLCYSAVISIFLFWLIKFFGNSHGGLLKLLFGTIVIVILTCIILFALSKQNMGSKLAGKFFLFCLTIGIVALANNASSDSSTEFSINNDTSDLKLQTDTQPLILDTSNSSNNTVTYNDNINMQVDNQNNMMDNIDHNNEVQNMINSTNTFQIFNQIPDIPINDFSFDPNALLTADFGGQSATLFSTDGLPVMKLEDGFILGADNSTVGSYEFNNVMSRNVFYDNSHNVIYSVDNHGQYFNQDGVYFGKVDKLGAVDVFMDNNQNIIYKTSNGAIFNDKGQILGTMRIS